MKRSRRWKSEVQMSFSLFSGAMRRRTISGSVWRVCCTCYDASELPTIWPCRMFCMWSMWCSRCHPFCRLSRRLCVCWARIADFFVTNTRCWSGFWTSSSKKWRIRSCIETAWICFYLSARTVHLPSFETRNLQVEFRDCFVVERLLQLYQTIPSQMDESDKCIVD